MAPVAGRVFCPDRFQIIWHRFGNSVIGVHAIGDLARTGPKRIGGRPIDHRVEVDLKWSCEDGTILLYGHHGVTGSRLLKPSTVRRRAASGRAILIEDLVAHCARESIGVVFELKGGTLPCAAAVAQLAALLDRHDLTDRASLASGCLPLLDEARTAAPDLPTILFAPFVSRRGRAVHAPVLDVRRSLARGLLVPGDVLGVDAVCAVGLVPASLRQHLEQARRVAASGLDYLPGRVPHGRAMRALAAAGLNGAFAWSAPVLS